MTIQEGSKIFNTLTYLWIYQERDSFYILKQIRNVTVQGNTMFLLLTNQYKSLDQQMNQG